jgi:hypothetical protein
MLITQIKLCFETIISLIWRDAFWGSEGLDVASKSIVNLIHNIKLAAAFFAVILNSGL